jgi:hypothetical protein
VQHGWVVDWLPIDAKSISNRSRAQRRLDYDGEENIDSRGDVLRLFVIVIYGPNKTRIAARQGNDSTSSERWLADAVLLMSEAQSSPFVTALIVGGLR